MVIKYEDLKDNEILNSFTVSVIPYRRWAARQ
jgi:hypothetical protein